MTSMAKSYSPFFRTTTSVASHDHTSGRLLQRPD
jgi:hypothetical protein